MQQARAETAARPADEVVTIKGRRGRASFTRRFSCNTNVVGPMLLTVTLSVEGGDDVSVFAGVRKFHNGHEVTFEGSYGFQGDLVTHGLLLASHRAVDRDLSLPYLPHHPPHRSEATHPR